MEKLSPIFQKELDAFEANFLDGNKFFDCGKTMIAVDKELYDFLLAALQRASLAVVEASIGEQIKFEWEDSTYGCCSICCGLKDDPECPHRCEVQNKFKSDTLATAREIIGGK